MQHVAPSTRKLMKVALNALNKDKAQEALDLFMQVLTLNPDHAEALYYVGFILHGVGNYAQASDYYQRAMHADPMYLHSYLMMCKVLEAQNRGQEAIQVVQHALQLMPQEAQAHCQLVSSLLRFNNAHLVPAYLESIFPQFPDHVELRQFYCIALKANNRFEEADAAYETLTALHRVPATFRIIYETMLPRLYQSSAHIDTVRDSFAKSIATFTAEKPQIDIGMLSNCPLFELAYHNRDNKEMLVSYTRMLRLIAPSLTYVAPHCKASLAKGNGPIRIGFVSAHMHHHSVGNSYRTLMLHLAAQPEFLVTFFNLSNVMDEKIQTLVDAALPIVSLPKNIVAAQKKIGSYELDILIYPDIGMDAMTHYMAMARLAPHQVCLGGHPETTGIDTIDYMIGSRSYEPPHAADNYTERLLCVDGVNTISTRTPEPERWLTLEELGLPTDKKLYVCPMAIQKFHPDYDAVLAQILARDPEAVLVLFMDFQRESATEMMQARLFKTCDRTRIIFMPWLKLEALFSVLKVADAVLDTIYFGGGTTVQFAFSFGIPIVSMPGDYARGRCVYSYYEVMQMEMDAPLAEDIEGFVTLAVKLANDTAYAASIREKILERNHLMFGGRPYGPLAVQLMHDIVAQNLSAYDR